MRSVDAVFNNGLTRINDLSKEAILQAIKDQDLRFLQVLCSGVRLYQYNKADFVFKFSLLTSFLRITILQVIKEKFFLIDSFSLLICSCVFMLLKGSVREK